MESKDYIKFLNLRFLHFWISSLIGQFKNSEKNLSWIFELTNQRRGRENSKFKNGPTLDQISSRLGPDNQNRTSVFSSICPWDYFLSDSGKSEVVSKGLWHRLSDFIPKFAKYRHRMAFQHWIDRWNLTYVYLEESGKIWAEISLKFLFYNLCLLPKPRKLTL